MHFPSNRSLVILAVALLLALLLVWLAQSVEAECEYPFPVWAGPQPCVEAAGATAR